MFGPHGYEIPLTMLGNGIFMLRAVVFRPSFLRVLVVQGIPIDVLSVQAEVFGAGVEVACLLVDVALKQMDDVCAEFFQADW